MTPITDINTADTRNKIIKKQTYLGNLGFYGAIPAKPSMCIGKKVTFTQ